ncbi:MULTISPECIES: phosphohydrolase [unclassified Pseudomonas]|uniref:phosphohydrolase n=1 Tax=unclassified Pseudomonas TaxID=196821 RepID=UPI002448ED70|nr:MULTISPECIES: phosphohydrolase [unclassified Pseudomonas]MDG9926150.1 phosphohydrolase [Pseudomonas sp. GD04045]MDH0037494.1 phosphohydrolase [Pseudomonas sp. GD04019]
MSWILTRSGLKFDLANPTASMVDPADIAHSLSMQCRFNGHTNRFYSVAQHCYLVADLVPAEHQLAALLHDATEAYVGDLVRPLKEGMRDFANGMGTECLYDLTERRVWIAICHRFDLDPHLPACVKHADLVALATEKRDLMPEHPEPWPCLDSIQPHAGFIDPWQPSYAAIHYHQRLLQLLATTHRGRALA